MWRTFAVPNFNSRPRASLSRLVSSVSLRLHARVLYLATPRPVIDISACLRFPIHHDTAVTARARYFYHRPPAKALACFAHRLSKHHAHRYTRIDNPIASTNLGARISPRAIHNGGPTRTPRISQRVAGGGSRPTPYVSRREQLEERMQWRNISANKFRVSDENLVERRCLGQTELKVKPGQVGTSNATKLENLGVLDYAHLRVPLPKDLTGSGIFARGTNRKWPEAYFLMVRSRDAPAQTR